MAHFAKIDENNIVVSVLVVSDEQENRGQEFLASDLGLGGTWIQTSYNTSCGVHLNGGIPLRKNFAGIGYFYDEVQDAFIPPKPKDFPSFVLDEETCTWVYPVEKPADNDIWYWDEQNISWTQTPVVSNFSALQPPREMSL
jgi:hypothetical protein